AYGAHAPVVVVRDEERGPAYVRHDGDARGAGEHGPSRGASVARGPPAPVAGDRADDVGPGVHLSYSLVMHVCDVYVTVGRERDVARHVQVGRRRRPTVSDGIVVLIAWNAIAGDRLDESGDVIHHAHAIVQRVGDVDVAVGRGRDGAGVVQRSVGRQHVVAVVPGVA